MSAGDTDCSFTELSNGPSVLVRAGTPRFTELECTLLGLIVEGSTNNEIGPEIQVSESYVKSIFQKLFQKTGVRTRSQIVRLAIEQYKDEL